LMSLSAPSLDASSSDAASRMSQATV
jgi:hypothetical protein